MTDNASQANNRQSARTRLAALRETKPPTKAAQVRALWPEIKAALDKGHTLKAACDCLQADGITLSVQTLGSYITRIRRKPTRIERLATPPQQELEERVRTEDKSAAYPVSVNRSVGKPRDPLANVRERLGKRTGFDYRPELADPKKLI
jgi:hypothetical protein